MKKIIAFACAAVMAVAAHAQTNFRSLSFNEALAAAKAEKKLVFIDFKTVWCGPCKLMAKEVFPDKAVGDFMNQHFVSIMMDAEKGEGADLAKTCEVTAYPTFVILNPDKSEVARSVGYKAADAFLAQMELLLDSEATLEKLQARYDSGERTPQLIKTYAAVLTEDAKEDRRGYREKKEEINKMVQQYFSGLSEDQKLSADNMFVYSRYTGSIEDAAAKYLTNNVKKFTADRQEEIRGIIEKLYDREEYDLMSGNKAATKELIAAFKNDVKRLNLNADGHLDNSIRLMEAYGGDGNQYMQLCRKLFKQFDETRQSALMESLANKFREADEATKKQASRVIREQLPDMDAQLLYTAMMEIMSLESNGH